MARRPLPLNYVPSAGGNQARAAEAFAILLRQLQLIKKRERK